MKNLTKKQKSLIFDKKNNVKKSLINAFKNCGVNYEERKIYHTYTTGSGRYTSNYSARASVVGFLNAFKYKFEEGNDASRNGATGDFIKVSKIAMDNFINIRNGNLEIL